MSLGGAMRNKDAPPQLGRLETLIMNVVWDLGRATVHDVRDSLKRRRRPAYSTILTMMRNLENKGYLKHDLESRKYVYHAVIERQRVRNSVLGDLVQRLFDGSPSLLVNSLLEQEGLTEEEISEIKKLIRDKEKER
jgi:predicted transcriptional regulator